MNKIIHILNGDALNEQFPDLPGERVVLRECLIEGNASGATWNEFIANRQAHIKIAYGEPERAYKEKVVSEFDKIKRIEDKSTVYLWFEDDLFCQVNFWFTCSLLATKSEEVSCYFVRAKATEQHGFGGMNKKELLEAYRKPIKIQATDIRLFAKFWNAYRYQNLAELQLLLTSLPDRFKFVEHAVVASLHYIPDQTKGLTIYEQQIFDLISENKSIKFKEVFQTFSKANSILGLGDSQVKRIYDKLMQDV